ncbi:hypothetical protein DLE60_27070 [Micromonospora globispora]|nr:hypothetical protein DLE60_27070 [Micromonospora globispora]
MIHSLARKRDGPSGTGHEVAGTRLSRSVGCPDVTVMIVCALRPRHAVEKFRTKQTITWPTSR